MRKISYIVTDKYDGSTLMVIFKDVMHLSGYLIRRNKHIYDAVQINNVHADVNSLVHTGDIVSVLISDVEINNNIISTKGNLNIVYEDEDIIALNKNANDIVHPDHAHLTNTLSNYLKYYYSSKNEFSNIHPIHRLDNGTSGLVLFAKNAYSQNILSKEFHSSNFSRCYIALCEGVFFEDNGVIKAPITKQSSETIKRCISSDGMSAVTYYSVIKRFENYTLAKINLETGRTHQIRVHMSSIGHPLIGDLLYDGHYTEYITRPALHSYQASFIHPINNNKITLTAHLPKDLQNQLIYWGYSFKNTILND